MTPAKLLDLARALWRAYGVRGSIARAMHEVRRKAGWFRSEPQAVSSLTEQSPLPREWPFIVDVARVKASTDCAEAIRRADRVLGGEYQAFRWNWMPLPKTPIEWRTHPITRFEHDIAQGWFVIHHYDEDAGDVKDVWEPARFGWSYDLIRGWMLTGNDAYARKFWEATEAFLEGNPPFKGIQWSCGQETSIRAVAWLWAEATLADAPSSTPARMQRLRRALIWSAERVEDAIGYAVIQRNNHGISEAAGLAVLGARFLDCEPRARRWLASANALLDEQLRDQFQEDGWYIQHSFNYARVALEQVVVAERALRFRGLGISPASAARIREAVRLLADLSDEKSGRLPMHGPNDGAYVLPLSTAPFEDFRPALTAAAATCGAPLPSGLAPDPEVLAWLSADAPAEAPGSRASMVRSGSSGWVLARLGDVLFFARAGTYTSRPTHIDPLHVDLWVGGRAVAIDAGTYRYWAAPPWENGLVIPEVHNTITIAGLPLAKRGPRYLWVRWPKARVSRTEANQERIRVELVNESWARYGVEHRRVCELTEQTLTVHDELRGPSTLVADVTAQWLLEASASCVSVEGSSPVSTTLTRGEPRSLFGWQSPSYGVRRPVNSLRATATLKDRYLKLVSTFDLASLRTTSGAERADTVTVSS